jgi:hypothetical protein
VLYFCNSSEVIYSTMLGNAPGWSYPFGAQSMAVDSAGNAYLAGYKPGRWSAYDDIFIMKLNSTGTAIIYLTYLYGSDYELTFGIAVDSACNVYITGNTTSGDFPTTPGAFDRTINGLMDVFCSKIDSNGSLSYSTFLGGGEGDAIAVDNEGNAYITGKTVYDDYPTTPGAFDTTYNGSGYGNDAFVSKLNPTGTALLYSTFLGGSDDDWGRGIAVDSLENAYITGYTTSSTFPTTPGAFDTLYKGNYDGFVSKLNASGTALVYSTYLGGSGNDSGASIAVDSAGNAFVIGGTDSSNFPTTPGAYDTSIHYSSDIFVTKLNTTGSALVYSTYIGGDGGDAGCSIEVDPAGNAYITGVTNSTDFPITASALDTTYMGGFVAKLNAAGSNLLYSSYIWGGQGLALAIDSIANVYITARGNFHDYFPVTPGAIDTTGNSFVCKLSLAPGPGPHFYANQSTGFNPLPVYFYDTSYGNPTSWYWNFGDGSTSTEKNPMHTYLHRGVYNVSLTATNSDGSNSITRNNYIVVNTTTKVENPFWTLFE